MRGTHRDVRKINIRFRLGFPIAYTNKSPWGEGITNCVNVQPVFQKRNMSGHRFYVNLWDNGVATWPQRRDISVRKEVDVISAVLPEKVIS